ncbi:TIR domain-containing protein [Lysinibacillus sp. NPDC093190]|uniref:TIR domain-containing protein n=1 Tax=Lysinibacillus sp. NPDC093190 TaxID=3390575 RepID=UPI003D01C306
MDVQTRINQIEGLKDSVQCIPNGDFNEVKKVKHISDLKLHSLLEQSSADKLYGQIANLNFNFMGIRVVGNDYSDRQYNSFEKARNSFLAILDTAIEEIKVKEELEQFISEKEDETSQVAVKEVQNDRIFLVHGHDRELLLEVDRFIRKLSLSPVILSEADDDGQTIIEKFERETQDTKFAIILSSPDDCGYSVVDGSDKIKYRARQNVIFEMGYFVGKLGRERTLTILKGELELPNDIQGVIYKKNTEDWQPYLAKKLSKLGYNVNPDWWK